MQYHEVKINIEFETKENCAASGTVSDLTNASLWVDYIFLDTDERRRFAQLSHEYLIEQLQFTGEEQVSAGNNRVKLNFNHPCKELVWVIRSDAKTGASNWFNYTDDSTDPTAGENLTTEAKLQLNGQNGRSEERQCSSLVTRQIAELQHTLLRETLPLELITTICLWKHTQRTVVIPLPNGKNVMGIG